MKFSSLIKNTLAHITLSVIVIITSVAYFTSYYGWNITLDTFSHFQVQYLLISLILLIVLLLLHRRKNLYWGMFFCGILSLQTLTWFLFPPHLFSNVNNQSDLKVLIANVYSQNESYDQVLDLVKTEKPDVAIFMEVTQEWQTQLDTLSNLLPYSSGRCSSCNLGILVYTKQKSDNFRVEFFGASQNSSIIAQLNFNNQPITLVATHPFSPLKSSFFHSRNQQLNLITQYLAGVDQRIILAGDLNLTMWSPYYRRLINKTGLSNTRKGFGTIPSWSPYGMHQQTPQILKWLYSLFTLPIDHCLVSKGLSTINMHSATKTGSDHLPLIVDLRITPLVAQKTN